MKKIGNFVDKMGGIFGYLVKSRFFSYKQTIVSDFIRFYVNGCFLAKIGVFCLEIDMQGHKMATVNISLPDKMKLWIEENVQSGHYANASDYVRDLIRRDNLKKEALRQALIDGENSGEPQPFDFEAFKARKRKEFAE